MRYEVRGMMVQELIREIREIRSRFLILNRVYEVLRYLSQQMMAGVASIDAVVAVGIDVHLEVLVSLHQFLSIFKGVLRVHIVISQSVTDEQTSM